LDATCRLASALIIGDGALTTTVPLVVPPDSM
jgi:hypothetical protein